ncbi:hypothetical protein [Gracilimonas sp.]|uniref:hypothetical protein n=1 Tax=Bacteroidota/Chlorobiota group TaxID=68336 RepID=UPI0032EDED65
MLTVPEHIEVQLVNSKGEPFKQAKIVVGIRTFATRKNDIELSPFVSNELGIVNISNADIQDRAENFISYGIMDYNSLESAEPTVELFIWTKDKITKYLNYWEPLLTADPTEKLADWQIAVMNKEMLKIQERERREFELLKNSFNSSNITKESKSRMNWNGTENTIRTTLTVK